MSAEISAADLTRHLGNLRKAAAAADLRFHITEEWTRAGRPSFFWVDGRPYPEPNRDPDVYISTDATDAPRRPNSIKRDDRHIYPGSSRDPGMFGQSVLDALGLTKTYEYTVPLVDAHPMITAEDLGLDDKAIRRVARRLGEWAFAHTAGRTGRGAGELDSGTEVVLSSTAIIEEAVAPLLSAELEAEKQSIPPPLRVSPRLFTSREVTTNSRDLYYLIESAPQHVAVSDDEGRPVAENVTAFRRTHNRMSRRKGGSTFPHKPPFETADPLSEFGFRYKPAYKRTGVKGESAMKGELAATLLKGNYSDPRSTRHPAVAREEIDQHIEGGMTVFSCRGEILANA